MPWNLNQSLANWTNPRQDDWKLTIDVNHPQRGVIVSQGAPLNRSTSVLGLNFEAPNEAFLPECYTRLEDLIAVYPQRAPRAYTLQVDYRVVDSRDEWASELLTLELWISIQTYLLDTYPQMTLHCPGDVNLESSKEESWQWTSQSLPDAPWFATYLVHPRDQLDAVWLGGCDGKSRELRLFGHFMEKGVIRRSRIRCVLSRERLSQEIVDRCYQEFVESPLPLTA